MYKQLSVLVPLKTVQWQSPNIMGRKPGGTPFKNTFTSVGNV